MVNDGLSTIGDKAFQQKKMRTNSGPDHLIIILITVTKNVPSLFAPGSDDAPLPRTSSLTDPFSDIDAASTSSSPSINASDADLLELSLPREW